MSSTQHFSGHTGAVDFQHETRSCYAKVECASEILTCRYVRRHHLRYGS